MPPAAAKQHALLVSHYEDAELHILRLIKDAVERGALGTAKHFQNQHRDLEVILKKVRAELDHMEGTISDEMLAVALDDYQAAYAASVQQAAAVSPVAAGVNTAAVGMVTEVQAIAAAGTAQLLKTHHQILRSASDAYQSVVATVVTRAAVTGVANPALVQDALDMMADRGIVAFVDRSGRRWGIDTYADMAVRTARNNSLNEGNIRGWEDAGLELVQGSWHPASAPQCVPFQRQLMAVKGSAGVRTVINATTGEEETVNVVDTLRGAIARGWHHPNCRHSDSPYVHGIKTPEPPAGWESRNEEQYEALQRQRSIERHIRRWKRREAVASTPRAQALARGKVRAWQAEMREHIDAHEYLSRQSVREQVRVGRVGAVTPVKPPRVVKPKPAAPTTPPQPQGGGRRRAANGGTTVEELMRGRGLKTKSEQITDEALAAMDEATRSRRRRWEREVANATPRASEAARLTASPDRQAWDSFPERLAPTPVRPDPVHKKSFDRLEDVPKTDRTGWDQVAQDANPSWRHGPHTGNCVRVTQAVELRRRGYDVVAQSGVYNSEYTSMSERIFLYDMAVDGNGSGIDNSAIAIAAGWETPEGLTRTFYAAPKARKGLKGGKNMATIREMEETVPDGARGFARCEWSRSNSGHIWNWVKEDGEIRFFEAQDFSGFVTRDTYLSRMKAGSLMLIRMDDMVPTDAVLHTVAAYYA